jgi:cell division protein ZapA
MSVCFGVPEPEGTKMRSFKLTVLGLDISFRAEADLGRVENAKALVEERFERLRFHGGRIGKEALLTFLALGLADDLLQSHDQQADVQNRIDALLTKIEDV